MNGMENTGLFKRIFEASVAMILAEGLPSRHKITASKLLRLFSTLILATIAFMPVRGLGAGAALRTIQPAATAAPPLGTTTRVSVASDGSQGNNDSRWQSISNDGRYVAFSSYASNLVQGDTNGVRDIFVHDRLTGSTERVSLANNGGEGNSDSFWPSISADGRYVAFSSYASNVVEDDKNEVEDIFVHDRLTGSTERVSLANNGGEGNSYSFRPSISADGRFVAFTSWASNLVNGDTNACADVFIYDRHTGVTKRISVAIDGMHGNSSSDTPSISSDGRFVAFESDATNLVNGDTNWAWDIFVHDRQTGIIRRVSVSSDGNQGKLNSDGIPSISADGRYVAFTSKSNNLVAGDTNKWPDVFVHDRETGITELISKASDDNQGNGRSSSPSISSDGRYVAFESLAKNLVVDDTNDVNDIFVHDRQTGVTERVSVANDGNQGNNISGDTSYSSISADGRYVAFESVASNLVSGDTNNFCDTDWDGDYEDNCHDVFLHDRGRITIVFYLPVIQNQP